MFRKTLATFGMALTFASTVAISDQLSPAAQINQSFQQYELARSNGDKTAAYRHAKTAYELAVQHNLPADTVIVLADNYAVAAIQRGYRAEVVVPILNEEIALIETSWGKNAVELINPLRDLARLIFNDDHEQQDAERRLRRVEDLINEHYPEATIDRAYNLYLLSEVQLVVGDHRTGRSNLDDAIEIYSALLPAEDVRVGLANHLAGRVEFARRDYRDAIEYFEHARYSLAPEGAPRNQAGLSALAFLVKSYSEVGDTDSATEFCLEIGRFQPFGGTADYEPIYRKAPEYPRPLAAANIEGYAIVEFTVDESGFVRNPQAIEVVTTRNDVPIETRWQDDLAESAIEAALQFRYAPRFVDGEPVATTGVKNRFTYELMN